MSTAEAIEAPYTILCDTDDEPDWLSARYAGIGSSEIGAVIGMNHRSSPLKLFLEKTGALEPDLYTLTVKDAITAVDSGKALDGEMTSSESAASLPSGDGLPGGSAVIRFSVTPAPGLPRQR